MAGPYLDAENCQKICRVLRRFGYYRREASGSRCRRNATKENSPLARDQATTQGKEKAVVDRILSRQRTF